jgi:hypothetical protein
MKLITVVALLVVGLGGYGLGQALSSDAVAMAVGVLFGMLAGIPTSLLMLTGRRHDQIDYWRVRAMEAEQRFRIVDKG